ncbi:hypothetical protein Poli38472_007695 [Pythium oligandrum]|uniref:Uncharacterized protein n=1 Tax=Pythium oligandrum TaxID=41045 RepID=A0A8K1FRY0_PYTOL|nr:hypothetical protein Poli38472_007695 [Pythium oligandrum]|eukprot:TMW68023.1 hypothetical protein Poli38472_007695 [Pythium oligandrum]
MPLDRDRPAGISSYREVKPVKKTPSGLNVQRFIAREEELHQARAYTKFNETNAGRARWEEKQNLRAGSGARLQQQKQLEEEMDLMNKELQVIRAERLKKYYDECYAKWEDELRARGLALIRDRD